MMQLKVWTKVKKSIIVTITFLSLMLPVSGAESVQDDVLLNTLPADCMFCIRINNFNESLGKLDSYLVGASPVPVSLAMMVNMQIGAIVGDPMLTGINMAEDFAVFATMPATNETDPSMGILVPVKNFNEFVKSNANCSPAEGGLALLTSPGSPLGNLILSPVGEKYALVVPEFEKATIPALQKALTGQSKLSKRLSSAQNEAALNSPLWAFINIADLYEKYHQDALNMFEMAKQGMSQQQPEMADMMSLQFKMLSEMLKTFGSDLDSATLALIPEASILSMDMSVQAKDNSELANMLTSNPQASGYKLTGYLDNNNAINALMKMNRTSMLAFYDKMYDVMEAVADDPTSKEKTAKMKALTQKMFDAMGDEVAVSYSYAAGIPPFRMQEIIEIKDPAAMESLMKEGMDYANTLYKSLGIPAKLEFQEGVSTYKNATIDTISISFENGDDPNNLMQDEIKKIYGDDFKYYLARTPEKFLITMGPDSEQVLKSLIDQPASVSPASGDIKIAMDTLQNTSYNDFVCSINIIKLMKGFAEMMQSMEGMQPGMNPFAGFFSDISTAQTQSCLIAGGKSANSSTSIRLALPKQHLIEIVAVAMQIQQKAMTMQPQMQSPVIMEEQNQTSAPTQAPEQNPFDEWIGKAAPDLKMVDLDGKIHRVSRLKGKMILLDFWATWCPPCKKSIPDLIKLRSDFNDSELAILGVSDEETDLLSTFVKEAKTNYPIISYKEKAPAPYDQVNVIPTLFIIDTKGLIQDVLVGYYPPEEIRSRLNKIN